MLWILKWVRLHPSTLQAKRRDKKEAPKLQNSVTSATKHTIEEMLISVLCVRCREAEQGTSTGDQGSRQWGHATWPTSQRPEHFFFPAPVLASTSGEHLSSKEISRHHTYVILTRHDRYPAGLEKRERLVLPTNPIRPSRQGREKCYNNGERLLLGGGLAIRLADRWAAREMGTAFLEGNCAVCVQKTLEIIHIYCDPREPLMEFKPRK